MPFTISTSEGEKERKTSLVAAAVVLGIIVILLIAYAGLHVEGANAVLPGL